MPLWTVSPIFQAGGALVAQLPDSAITGGNARGANAVDWQTLRGAATQVASGLTSVIGGGENNTASGVLSVASGGFSNITAGNNSWCPGGRSASTRTIHGMGAWGGGALGAGGDSQSEEHVLRRQTPDATTTRLTSDNGVAGVSNTINLANFQRIAGILTVVAGAAGSTASATWRINVSVLRGSGAGTTVVYEGVGAAIVPTASNGTGSAWRLDIAADTTNGGIAVSGTGAAATTINWHARFSASATTLAS